MFAGQSEKELFGGNEPPAGAKKRRAATTKENPELDSIYLKVEQGIWIEKEKKISGKETQSVDREK